MDDVQNRMATPGKKRGRPTKAAIEARPPAKLFEPAAVTVSGMVCPCCGRAMVPKVLRVTDSGKYCRCTSCGGQFRVYLDGTHRKVQPLQ